MEPAFSDGDYVVCRRTRTGHGFRPGQVIVYSPAKGHQHIKRIHAVLDDERYRVRGDSPLSSPGTDIAPVRKDTILGRVVFSIRGPRGKTGQTRTM